MGGIRGDVIALTFLQTVIMEMGQPADATAATLPGFKRANTPVASSA